MEIREIVTQVRSAIDELMVNDSDFLRESNDEANLTRVIVDKIGYALQHLLEVAPLEKLDSSVFAMLPDTYVAANFSIDPNLVGRLILPTDCLRIIEARLSTWSHFPVPEDASSPVYLMQQDEYARGSWDRPVNILTYVNYYQQNKLITGKVLEMYSAQTSQDKLRFVYVATPDFDAIRSYDPETNPQGIVEVPTALEKALIYQTAGLAMVAFREDIAASLFTIADNYLNQGLKT